MKTKLIGRAMDGAVSNALGGVFALRKLLCIMAAGTLLLCNGCFSNWTGDEATITINLGAAGNRGVDDIKLKDLEHTITLSWSGSDQTFRFGKGVLTAHITVTPGIYTVSVEAYLSQEDCVNAQLGAGVEYIVTGDGKNKVAYSKPISVEVKPGKNTPVPITMRWVGADASPEEPEITGEPDDEAFYTVGTTQVAALTVTVTPVSDGGTLSYQWYRGDGDAISDATPIPGAIASSYTPSAAQVGTVYYHVVVTNTLNGKTATTTSRVVKIEVNTNVNAEPPVIDEQPQEVVYTYGDATAPLLAVTARATDGGTLSYQWYSNTQNRPDGGAEVGYNSPSYTPPTNSVGTMYYCVVVTNIISEGPNVGNRIAAITSDVVAVTVKPKIAITSEVTGEIRIVAGGTVVLGVIVDPLPGTSVTWSSHNPGVATVSETGVVTGVAAGDAVIRATTNDSTNAYAEKTITVRDPVVYVAGYEKEDSLTYATLWKDSNRIRLSGNHSKESNDVCVAADGTAYVAGTDREDDGVTWKAKLWTVSPENVVTPLDLGNGNFDDFSICLTDDGAVWVAGTEGKDAPIGKVGKVWKVMNGALTATITLPDPEVEEVQIEDICAVGNTVYAVGQVNNTVWTLWTINGKTLTYDTQLLDGTSTAGITSIYATGGAVYLTGQDDEGRASRWRFVNGTGGSINLSQGGMSSSSGESMCIANGAEYVAGVSDNGSENYPTLWKVSDSITTISLLVSGIATGEAYGVCAALDGTVYVTGVGFGTGDALVTILWKVTTGEATMQLLPFSPGMEGARGNAVALW